MLWWIILVLVGFYFIGFIIDLRLIFYYEHPEDSKYMQGLLAKGVACLGTSIVWLFISGLPTDAFNAAFDGGLDMGYFWSTALLLGTVYIAIPLPFATFMYESDSDPRVTKRKGWVTALIKTAVVLVVVAIVVGALYPLVRHGSIDVVMYHCKAVNNVPATEPNTCDSSTATTQKLNLTVDFMAYLAGITSFVGYWFFSVYTGIGLVSLPFDMILEFIYRPKPIDLDEFKARKREVGEQAAALRCAGEALKRKELQVRDSGGIKGWGRKLMLKSDVKKFRQSVYLLEKEFTDINTSLKKRGVNPFFAYLKLSVAVLCALTSILWILHITLYTGAAYFFSNITGCWNEMLILIRRSKVFFIDLIIMVLLMTYLLLASVKGSFKFGMRIFFGFPIHPMLEAETRSNTMLFNATIVLMSTFALNQFAWQSFRDYSNGTELEFIYSCQVNAIPFFRVFYRYAVFTWIILTFSILTGIYLGIRPRDKPAITKDFTPAPAGTSTRPDQVVTQTAPASNGPNDRT